MDKSSDEGMGAESVENVGADATCAPGCDCNAGSSGGRGRWIVGIAILIVAGGLVARAMVKDNRARGQEDEATFAVVAPATDASQSDAPEPSAEGVTEDATPAPVPTKTGDKVVATIAGKEIATLADLNRIAADTDAVFVYLPGQDVDPAMEAPTSALEGAVRTIKSRGVNVGIFTLKAGAPEYTPLAAQMKFPGVIAVVKGRGMSTVSDDIAETKLIQAFVTASSGGGCGPSSVGCGPSGCK